MQSSIFDYYKGGPNAKPGVETEQLSKKRVREAESTSSTTATNASTAPMPSVFFPSGESQPSSVPQTGGNQMSELDAFIDSFGASTEMMDGVSTPAATPKRLPPPAPPASVTAETYHPLPIETVSEWEKLIERHPVQQSFEEKCQTLADRQWNWKLLYRMETYEASTFEGDEFTEHSGYSPDLSFNYNTARMQTGLRATIAIRMAIECDDVEFKLRGMANELRLSTLLWRRRLAIFAFAFESLLHRGSGWPIKRDDSGVNCIHLAITHAERQRIKAKIDERIVEYRSDSEKMLDTHVAVTRSQLASRRQTSMINARLNAHPFGIRVEYILNSPRCQDVPSLSVIYIDMEATYNRLVQLHAKIDHKTSLLVEELRCYQVSPSECEVDRYLTEIDNVLTRTGARVQRIPESQWCAWISLYGEIPSKNSHPRCYQQIQQKVATALAKRDIGSSSSSTSAQMPRTVTAVIPSLLPREGSNRDTSEQRHQQQVEMIEEEDSNGPIESEDDVDGVRDSI